MIREEIARWLFRFKEPIISGESGADANYNTKWTDLPMLLRESYRKSATELLSLIVADDQTVELLNEEEIMRVRLLTLGEVNGIEQQAQKFADEHTNDYPEAYEIKFRELSALLSSKKLLNAQASKMIKGDGKTKWMKVKK